MSAGSPQAIASNPRQSAWVAANAGSGKTHVLVQRILRLLLDGADPQRILCLTFTKAAAAEMSARLYKQLAGWIALDDEALRAQAARLGETGIDQAALSRARRLFARALETPGGLKIQTIHAFCERLLQLFPLEAGVTPGFQVIEEGDAIALREDCRRDVLAASDPELAGAKALLAARTDAQGFAKLLHQLSRQRQDFDASPASVLRLRAALGLDASDTPETLAQEMTRLGSGDFARTAAILESGPTKTEVKTGAGLRQVVAAAGTPLARDLKGLWRFRVRRFRIVYSVDRARRTIRVMAVAHRRHIYDDLIERVRPRKD